MTDLDFKQFKAVPDPVGMERLIALLCGVFDGEVFCFNTVTSTNDFAKAAIGKGLKKAMILSEEQTAGRGRMGRVFSSKNGGLYVTFILPLQSFEEQAILLQTAACSVALCSTVKKICGLNSLIKWPNDIFINDKKLCGILIEHSLIKGLPEAAVIGIGINLCDNAIPEELKGVATSIEAEGGGRPDRFVLAAKLAEELQDEYALLKSRDHEAVLSSYRSLQYLTGKDINVMSAGAVRQAKALGVNECGALLVRFCGEEQSQELMGGEVSIRIK